MWFITIVTLIILAIVGLVAAIPLTGIFVVIGVLSLLASLFLWFVADKWKGRGLIISLAVVSGVSFAIAAMTQGVVLSDLF